jgi:hypothetical protein
MTPKEKAVELFTDYRYISSMPNAPLGELKDYMAKQSALRAADEVKEQLIQNLDNEVSSIHAIYWEKVKTEINKL